jgi:hypothetical protein
MQVSVLFTPQDVPLPQNFFLVKELSLALGPGQVIQVIQNGLPVLLGLCALHPALCAAEKPVPFLQHVEQAQQICDAACIQSLHLSGRLVDHTVLELASNEGMFLHHL